MATYMLPYHLLLNPLVLPPCNVLVEDRDGWPLFDATMPKGIIYLVGHTTKGTNTQLARMHASRSANPGVHISGHKQPSDFKNHLPQGKTRLSGAFGLLACCVPLFLGSGEHFGESGHKTILRAPKGCTGHPSRVGVSEQSNGIGSSLKHLNRVGICNAVSDKKDLVPHPRKRDYFLNYL